MLSAAARYPPALSPASITVLAYGALLSERSARLTFPALSNFRLARVQVLRLLRRAVPAHASTKAAHVDRNDASDDNDDRNEEPDRTTGESLRTRTFSS